MTEVFLLSRCRTRELRAPAHEADDNDFQHHLCHYDDGGRDGEQYFSSLLSLRYAQAGALLPIDSLVDELHLRFELFIRHSSECCSLSALILHRSLHHHVMMCFVIRCSLCDALW